MDSFVLGFILGIMAGGIVSAITVALCVAARDRTKEDGNCNSCTNQTVEEERHDEVKHS